MATNEEHLVDWLRDAHAMEQQAETMMTALCERIENYPPVRDRLQQHIAETRTQAQRLERCLERIGGDTSAIKDLAGRATAFGQGLSGMFVDDEIVKGALASYAFENMEIASYTILIAAAEAVGDTETRDLCDQSLQEEKAMAAWLVEHLPALTKKFLARDEVLEEGGKR
ncbi:ferritin-like domain-containing protein [Nitrospirillum sp. BR 11828]|uniref:ferritin-like domain-containing protein n=1 Tax=Nitrospirillum sp. BR 11828 TaxID=3104325 RepID=UPI002ACAE2A0|nr:ferritin-like domain-containing protein [Nitrospirillum sp. BR 11828]MDZ5645782.1 ferritin-like domain-containing protein [Nitrospirillum sp. BR 11828]